MSRVQVTLDEECWGIEVRIGGNAVTHFDPASVQEIIENLQEANDKLTRHLLQDGLNLDG